MKALTLRRVLIVLCIVLALITAAIPAGAAPARQMKSQPHHITGTYLSTNPIYPTIGADAGVILYDFYGQIAEDYAFVSPPVAQVIGQMEGDISSGTYQIDLPDVPQGTPMDFDGDPASPPAVQVFVTGTYINILGDEFINRGEGALDISARLEPMTYDIIGGNVVVWSAHDGEKFPAGMGPDGAAFTADDPLMDLSAGWSVVSLDSDPFTVTREDTVEIPVVETLGALNDYSDLSYREAWDKLFARTRETYPFVEEKHLDWDQIYDTITPAVDAATSDLEFHLAIAQLGEMIPDTHIGYASVPVLQAFLVGGVGVSKLAVTDQDEIIIMGVEEKGPAAKAGLAVGDELIAVDGDPALQVLNETPLLINSASTPHGRRYLQTATMLQGPVGSKVTLTWRSPDGQEQTQTLKRVFDVEAILQAFEPADPDAEVISSRLLDSGVGVITVRGFAEDVSAADQMFGDALQSLIDQGAKGIILDVRSNSGGLVSLAMSMAGRFFPDYERILDFYYADGEGGFAYRGYMETLTGEPTYAGPVAVLVNEMTGSAGDIFTYTMTYGGRAIVVGNTPSGGFTGEVSDGQYTLPGDLTLQIPTGRPVDPQTGETLIEGTGVMPDVRVAVTRESLLSPTDEVLDAAEDAILNQAFDQLGMGQN